eukprot:259080-Prymnesium_polylepis.1
MGHATRELADRLRAHSMRRVLGYGNLLEWVLTFGRSDDVLRHEVEVRLEDEITRIEGGSQEVAAYEAEMLFQQFRFAAPAAESVSAIVLEVEERDGAEWCRTMAHVVAPSDHDYPQQLRTANEQFNHGVIRSTQMHLSELDGVTSPYVLLRLKNGIYTPFLQSVVATAIED